MAPGVYALSFTSRPCPAVMLHHPVITYRLVDTFSHTNLMSLSLLSDSTFAIFTMSGIIQICSGIICGRVFKWTALFTKI